VLVAPWWCFELCRASPGSGVAKAVECGLLPWSRICGGHGATGRKLSPMSVTMVATSSGLRFSCWGTIEGHHVSPTQGSQGENPVFHEH
jgi:hypothetical protein